jgi:hypothetical protein
VVDALALHRVGSMVGQLLEELRIGEMDAAALDRANTMYNAGVSELGERLDTALAGELERLLGRRHQAVPVTIASLRIAQAQLIGWLEGILAATELTEPPADATAAGSPSLCDHRPVGTSPGFES